MRFVAVIGVAVAAAVSIPAVRFYLQGTKLRLSLSEERRILSLPLIRLSLDSPEISSADASALQRCLVYYLAKIAPWPILIFVLATWVMPAALRTSSAIYDFCLLPRFRSEMAEIRSTLDSTTHAGPQQGEISEIARRKVDRFEAMVMADGFPISDLQLKNLVTPIRGALSWALTTGFALLFVLPYLRFSGWGRGLFYGLLLLTTLGVENLLQNYVPWLFGVERGPAAWLVTFFAIFGLALFADWIYATVTERVKTCPNCGARIDAEASYCPTCGMVQL